MILRNGGGFHEAETMELFKEDGRAEGRAGGRAEGRIANIVHNVRALLAETDWSVDKALDVLHVSPEDRSIVVAQL